MKSNLKTVLASFLAFFLINMVLSAQEISTDSTGFPGDNFSLEGALALFEKATSLEDFEKQLNEEKNYVNNLDLNEDGEIDYIRIVDNMEGDVHAIVLQVPMSKTETQDIAVIEIEKTGKEEAILQIVGDEDVYGEQKIIEPFDMQAKSKGKGPSADLEMKRVVVNVFFWPCVRFVYAPSYRVYVSPWGWSVYPRYWRPWRPHPWHVHIRNRVHHPHFRVCHTHRVMRAHRVYAPRRKTTTTVRTKTTVVKNRKGNVVGVKKNKTTTVRGKNGKVKAQKSKTIGVRKTKNGKVKRKRTTKKTKKRRH